MQERFDLAQYRRQLILFGEEGQRRLLSARIFIAGVGGLGCPAALYLAAAGIGHIRILDRDTVSRSNLNRQILHYTSDIGRAKAMSAREKLGQLNPDIEIIAIEGELNSELPGVIRDMDIVVDATDNFEARYLLNECCLEHNIPMVHGGIRGFFGQAMTIIPTHSACLRCVFPHPPPGEEIPALGVTAGIIGLIQANEVIKYLLTTGDLLTNRLLLWDGLKGQTEIFEVERNPYCDTCRKFQPDPDQGVKQ